MPSFAPSQDDDGGIVYHTASGDSPDVSSSNRAGEGATGGGSDDPIKANQGLQRGRRLYADRSKEVLPPIAARDDYSKEPLAPIGERTALDDYPLSSGLHTDLGPLLEAPNPNNVSGLVQSAEHP